MSPDAVSPVGGATPTDATTPAKSTPATASAGAAFGEAMAVAKAAASAPRPAAAASAEAQARARELGLAGGAGAYDVLGHRYARVEGGEADGRYVNTSGNSRHGQTFEIVERGGHVFHVYDDHVVRVKTAAEAADGASAG